MLVEEIEIEIPVPQGNDPLAEIGKHVSDFINGDGIPIRFVVTDSSRDGYTCEVGVISGLEDNQLSKVSSIFNFERRHYENADQFNIALLIPTGVGCEMGGHSGDGGALARLFASAADNLITHPNVVNAADINELPENGLYVEGSLITQLLMGTIGLQKVRSNRVLLIIDEHPESMFHELAINSASAARASMGINCPLVIQLEKSAILRALTSTSGRAVGRIERLETICEVIDKHLSEFDAVALSTLINVPKNFHADYFKPEAIDMVNPWGGVEAMLTHAISSIYQIPTAHSPMMNSSEILNLDVGVVDPRKAAEAVSTTYLHCILKGMHRAPRPVRGQHPDNPSILDASNISCLVIPDGCLGLPVFAALEQGIPVISVVDKHCKMNNDLSLLPFAPGQLHVAQNYLEALGIVMSLRAGVSTSSVTRPLDYTHVLGNKKPTNFLETVQKKPSHEMS